MVEHLFFIPAPISFVIVLFTIQIDLLLLHPSHGTQLLDASAFSSLKTHLSTERNRHIRTGIPHTVTAKQLESYTNARLTYSNIISGFRGNGLNSFNSQKVFNDCLPAQSNHSKSYLKIQLPNPRFHNS